MKLQVHGHFLQSHFYYMYRNAFNGDFIATGSTNTFCRYNERPCKFHLRQRVYMIETKQRKADPTLLIDNRN